MQKKVLALAAATLATTIYGINHTVAKSVMPIYIGSLGFVLSVSYTHLTLPTKA